MSQQVAKLSGNGGPNMKNSNLDEVPKFYTKYLKNEIRISAKPMEGYVLHPQFEKAKEMKQ